MPDAPPEPVARKFSALLFLRSLAGLILAPVFGGGVSVGLFSVFGAFGDGSGGVMISNFPEAASIGAYIGALYGVLPALVIGWPIHLVLLRQKWTHPLVYAAIGSALAVLAIIVTIVVTGNRLELDVSVLMFALAGSVGGVLFWLIRHPVPDPRINPAPEIHHA